MNRSQLVFVIIVNALFTLLIASAGYLIYELRRPHPAGPVVVAFPTPPSPTPTSDVLPTPSDPDPVEAPSDRPLRTYTIREGDTLGAIADLFGVEQSALAALNGITNPNLIVPGQSLLIPEAGLVGLTTRDGLQAADLTLQVLNAGRYAEEAVVIVNLHSPRADLSDWSVVTDGDGAYMFQQIPPLLRGESLRLYSRSGEDTAYDKHWGRTPHIWGPGTKVSLHNPNGAEVLSTIVSQ